MPIAMAHKIWYTNIKRCAALLTKKKLRCRINQTALNKCCIAKNGADYRRFLS